MKYLFIFAHPDDETVACAGTLHKLVAAGENVMVVSVTAGDAGEVSEKAQPRLKTLGNVGELRRLELNEALEILGVKQYKILDYKDGQITNEMVWGKLRSDLIELIDGYKPDVVVSFDHSGWYFHLDHVGTSIATTWAVQQAKFPPSLYFLSHFRVANTKWKYVYTDKMPFTHVVDVTDLKQMKLAALNSHVSQNLTEPKRQLEAEKESFEFYQLAFSTPAGKKLLTQQQVFQAKR